MDNGWVEINAARTEEDDKIWVTILAPDKKYLVGLISKTRMLKAVIDDTGEKVKSRKMFSLCFALPLNFPQAHLEGYIFSLFLHNESIVQVRTETNKYAGSKFFDPPKIDWPKKQMQGFYYKDPTTGEQILPPHIAPQQWP